MAPNAPIATTIAVPRGAMFSGVDMVTSIFAQVMMGGLPPAVEPDTLITPADELDASDIVTDLTPSAGESIFTVRDSARGARADLIHTPWLGLNFAVRAAAAQRIFRVDPAEAAQRFAVDLRSMRSAVDIENYVNREADAFHDVMALMRYLEGVLKAVLAGRERYSRDDRLRTLHFLAGKVDAASGDFLPYQELVAASGLVHRIACSADEVEREQLDAKMVPRDFALRSADIYYTLARRSEYPRYLLKSRRANGTADELGLASAILRLRDVAKRFELQRDSTGMASAFNCMMELRNAEHLREADVTWAFNRIVEFVERKVSEWSVERKARGDQQSIEKKMKIFDSVILQLVMSMYLYSPLLLESASGMLGAARFDNMAVDFARRAVRHRVYAERLGIL